ncbi:peptidase C48, SUMO/sentrin/Ubl1 [Tanacetum coccineum]
MISSGVIDIFSKVLNHAELYCDPMKQIRRVFCETSMMHEWDVKGASEKEHDVKESADKFNQSMLHILRNTAYRNLHNVDLVFFPIIQGNHFFVVCMHLKRKEVHILNNMCSLITDVSERYGDVVYDLVARFLDYLTYENHPAQGVMRNAACTILRLGCMTKKNFIDCGVFAMRHMETYMGGGEYDDLCALRRECKAHKLQLDELRIKYAAKILLSDINFKKSEFEVEAEAYRRLPLEERQRLEEGAFEKVKARVTHML